MFICHYLRRLVSYLCIYTSLPIITQAQAPTEFIHYHPLSPVAIGKGVTRYFPLIEHNNCIDYTKVRAMDSTGAREVNFEYYLAKDTRTLQQSLGISGEIQANSKFFGKAGKLLEKTFGNDSNVHVRSSRIEDESLDDTSIAIVIKAYADYGRFEIQTDNGSNTPFRLFPQYQDMIDEGSYENFSRICGTHFVIRETRKGMVSAIIKIKDLTLKQKTEIATKIFAGLGAPRNEQSPSHGRENQEPGQWDNEGGPPTQPPRTTRPPNFPNLPGAGAAPRRSGSRNTPTLPNQRPRDPISDFFIVDNMMNSVTPLMATGNNSSVTANLDRFLNELESSTYRHTIKVHALGGGGLSALAGFLDAQVVGPNFLATLREGFSRYLKSFTDASSGHAKTIPAIYQLASMEMFGFQPSDFSVNTYLLEMVYYEFSQTEANIFKINNVLNNNTAYMFEQDLLKLREEYRQNLRTLWTMARSLLDGNQGFTSSDIPDRTPLNLGDYSVGVRVAENVLDCYTRNGAKCGDSIGFFNPFRKYWESYFVVKGKVINMENIEQVELWSGNEVTHTQKLFSNNVPVDMTQRKFSSNGEFYMRFGFYSSNENTDNYHKIYQNLPYLYLVIKTTSSREEVLPLGRVKLKGAHPGRSENPEPEISLGSVSSNIEP